MSLIVTERPYLCDIKIWHGEDWYDPLPELESPITGDPYDLTSVTLELFARPAFDHTTRFVLLSSFSGGIIKEDAANGLAAIFYSKANVEANLPASGQDGWRQFFRLSFTDAELGSVKKLLWTGKLSVFPAEDAATV